MRHLFLCKLLAFDLSFFYPVRWCAGMSNICAKVQLGTCIKILFNWFPLWVFWFMRPFNAITLKVQFWVGFQSRRFSGYLQVFIQFSCALELQRERQRQTETDRQTDRQIDTQKVHICFNIDTRFKLRSVESSITLVIHPGYRISFKLCLLMFKVMSGSAPLYLSSLVISYAAYESRWGLRAASKGDFVVKGRKVTLWK